MSIIIVFRQVLCFSQHFAVPLQLMPAHIYSYNLLYFFFIFQTHRIWQEKGEKKTLKEGGRGGRVTVYLFHCA